MKFRLLLAAAVLTAFSGATATAVVATPEIAGADPVHAPICGSGESTVGTALSGDYHNLTVTGVAYVDSAATLTVSGNLTVAPGACLDAFSLGTVSVGNNVVVGPRATLALGCAPGANGPPGTPPCGTTTADDTVGGSIIADQPLTMYLTAVAVSKNVVSSGGGFSTPGLSFPVKNMIIGGNLVLSGWHGGPQAWIGALRNQVGGNMVVTNNVGDRPGEVSGNNDSTEILGNSVGHNLICNNNTPSANYGDGYDPAIGNGPNAVGHRAIGECTILTTPELTPYRAE